jgi:hypothetical protein
MPVIGVSPVAKAVSSAQGIHAAGWPETAVLARVRDRFAGMEHAQGTNPQWYHESGQSSLSFTIVSDAGALYKPNEWLFAGVDPTPLLVLGTERQMADQSDYYARSQG